MECSPGNGRADKWATYHSPVWVETSDPCRPSVAVHPDCISLAAQHPGVVTPVIVVRRRRDDGFWSDSYGPAMFLDAARRPRARSRSHLPPSSGSSTLVFVQVRCFCPTVGTTRVMRTGSPINLPCLRIELFQHDCPRMLIAQPSLPFQRDDPLAPSSSWNSDGQNRWN